MKEIYKAFSGFMLFIIIATIILCLVVAYPVKYKPDVFQSKYPVVIELNRYGQTVGVSYNPNLPIEVKKDIVKEYLHTSVVFFIGKNQSRS